MATDPQQIPKRASLSTAILSFLLLALFAWIAIAAVRPPSAALTDAPRDQFSAGRALPALREIARRPHPTGSAEHARVREAIVTRMRELGLAPEVQTATASTAKQALGALYDAATVRNIVARIKGTGGTKAVMLAAHYDSVPGAPGAGDDGSGVVTVLETARALMAGPRLRNDVIVLVTDAEELGLLGARAFVDEHPWAGDVGVVLNFEARGTAGPSLMYRTTPRNGWLIRQLARSGAHPNASSLFSEASRRLPTGDSDHSVFKKAGMSGLDFAFIDNGARYHSGLDDVGHLDPRTLQQHGDSALALARHFGNLDLTRTTTPDAIYFNLFGVVVAYPESWAVPLLVVAVLLTFLVVVLGFVAGRLTAGGLAVGTLGYLLASAVAAGACELIWRALLRRGAVPIGSYGMPYNLHPYGVAFVALTVAVFVALYALVRNRVRRENLVAGALVCWLVLTVATTLWFVGGSYLFLWPLVVALLTLAFEFTRPEPSTRLQLVTWIPATVVVLLLAGAAPYLLLMLVADTMLLVTVPVVIILGLLLPQIHIVQGRGEVGAASGSHGGRRSPRSWSRRRTAATTPTTPAATVSFTHSTPTPARPRGRAATVRRIRGRRRFSPGRARGAWPDTARSAPTTFAARRLRLPRSGPARRCSRTRTRAGSGRSACWSGRLLGPGWCGSACRTPRC